MINPNPQNRTWLVASVAANHSYTVFLAWGVRQLERLYVSLEPGTFEKMEMLPIFGKVLLVMILANPATWRETWRLVNCYLDSERGAGP